MKKLTRKSLDELAKVMPVISKYEQRDYIAGDLYNVDQNGHFNKIIDFNMLPFGLSQLMGSIDITTSGSGTYIMPTGVLGNPQSNSESNYTLYSGQIQLSFFEFLSKNTSVEWHYTQIGNDGLAILTTSNLPNQVNYPIVNGATGSYHNHSGTDDGAFQPSSDDIVNRYSNCRNFIYVSGANMYVAY